MSHDIGSKDNGGPAFPSAGVEGMHGEAISPPSYGMTLRDYAVIHAPASEIGDMAPSSIEGAAAFLGIPVSDYKSAVHWPQVLMKLRRAWADAMLAERAK